MKQRLIVLFAVFAFAAPMSFADVQIVRDDSENPMVSIAKSTFYGALLGTVVSLAIMLVAGGDDDDIFKVSFASGTALGLGVGIYHVATRPSGGSTHALLNIKPDHTANLAIPQIGIGVSRRNELRVSAPILAWNF